MDEHELSIVLSSLLHDIGKFYQRTHTLDECKIKERIVNHEELFLKVKRDCKFKTNKITIDIFDDGIKDYIDLGDWITSQEREDVDKKTEITSEDVRKDPIISIFEIYCDSNSDVRFKPKSISFEKPKKDEIVQNEMGTIERDLYYGFIREMSLINRINIDDDEDSKNLEKKRRYYIRCVLDCLKKYAFRIPSASYYSQPTIDLFNHSKSSAGMSLVIYRYYKNSKQNLAQLKKTMREIFMYKKDEKPIPIDLLNDEEYNKKSILILKGDISGIQDFISTISTKGAAKFLKARSFYINLLNKIAAQKLLLELDLPETNLIYCSGGSFEIICDNNERNKQIAKNLFEKINDSLFKMFRTKLFFGLTYTEMSPRDFTEDFRNFYNRLQKNTGILQDKHRKFEKILIEKNFQAEYAGYDSCDVCKSEIEESDDEFSLCESCNQIQYIKNMLKKAQENFNFPKLERKEIFIFDDVDELFFNGKISLTPYSPFEIITTGMPIKNNTILELSEICKSKKMGVLKFDVDNLGDIFKTNFAKEGRYKISFSMYSSLSFNISLFFEGIINRIWEEKYKDSVYILYSGGDDGFLVGDFASVLNFANDIYNYFKIYTGFNPKFTISASFRIFDTSFPIKKIFEIMENDLKEAKSARREKNCISINGNIIRWEYFDNFEKGFFSDALTDVDENKMKNDFEFLVRLTNYLNKKINEKSISSVTLHKLIEISSKTLDFIEKNIKEKEKIIPNIYIMNYMLKRNAPNVSEKIFTIWKKCIFSNSLTEEGYNEMLFKIRCFKLAAELAEMNKRYRGEMNG
ncbi:MAG: type III-A CRISPR-associated protein Cas10/Csm1 [Candidatus Aenigmarchaeota archaeon]|nr:type III-A CRISPR-associated protein Cas10/Csm1 [Candidatus Aenigmarchaeota archaeon]